MTVEEAKDLKSGNKVHDTYFNRRGEVTATSNKGFYVKYVGETTDEFVSFDKPESVADFVKMELGKF